MNIQDLIEKYYPNYYSSEKIARYSDLSKLVDDEWEEGDSADDLLESEYHGNAHNPDIEKDFRELQEEIVNYALAKMEKNRICYLETYYEVASFLGYNLNSPAQDENPVCLYYMQQGRYAIATLAMRWSDEFENKYNGVEWGLEVEWIDTLDNFLKEKIKTL